MALAGCAKSVLGVESNTDGVHASATNGASGTANGSITIEEGYGLCINHIVEKGSFHVTVFDESGEIVFDEDITNNIADLIDVQGNIELLIEAKNATGTIDVIPYDIKAQAMADETLDDALAEVDLSREELGLSSASSTPAGSSASSAKTAS